MEWSKTMSAIQDIQPSALKVFEDITCGYSVDKHQSHWKGITFTDKGASKISNVAGFLVGLAMGGRQELAEKMATDINGQLTKLSQWGDDVAITHTNDGHELVDGPMVPSTQVMLSDDGTFGGFSVAWYSYVSHAKVREEAEGMPHDSDGCLGMYEARRKLGINNALTTTRYGRPPKHDANGPLGSVPCDVYYGFYMNGGLLLHGMGQEVFAVEVGNNQSGPHWSLHT